MAQILCKLLKIFQILGILGSFLFAVIAACIQLLLLGFCFFMMGFTEGYAGRENLPLDLSQIAVFSAMFLCVFSPGVLSVFFIAHGLILFKPESRLLKKIHLALIFYLFLVLGLIYFLFQR